MSKLVALREALDAADLGDGARADGWTGARRRAFLEHLADGVTVEKACAWIGLSVASAYALRRRAEGEAFALGWRAARLLGRECLADILIARAIDGQTETYTRADGQEVTRHRHDNRLGLGLLTRLDRMVEGYLRPLPGETPPLAPSPDEPADVVRVVAADFPAFLDLIEREEAGAADPAAVRAFVAAAIARRYPQPPQLGPGPGMPASPAAPYWREDGEWYTALPPPYSFHGEEIGVYGEPDYARTLTAEEEDIAEALAGGAEGEA